MKNSVAFRHLLILNIHLLLTLFGVAHASSDNDIKDVHALLRQGRLVEAEQRLDRYLAAKPGDPQLRFIKGVIQRDAGRTNDAIAIFSKLTQDHPELPEPYNNLAVLYASQNQYDKARETLEMALRTNPSYATAHANLGDIYARLASQAYSKALQIEGDNKAQPPLAMIREVFDPHAKGRAPLAAPDAPVNGSPQVVALAPPTVAQPKPQATAAVSRPEPAPTPPAPSATPAQPPAAQPPASDDAVQAAVNTWARAWADKDMTGYLAAYSPAYVAPDKKSRREWEEERRERIVGKRSIQLQISDLQIERQADRAVAKFIQHYKADAFSATGRKTLELERTEGRWVIVKETVGR